MDEPPVQCLFLRCVHLRGMGGTGQEKGETASRDLLRRLDLRVRIWRGRQYRMGPQPVGTLGGEPARTTRAATATPEQALAASFGAQGAQNTASGDNFVNTASE